MQWLYLINLINPTFIYILSITCEQLHLFPKLNWAQNKYEINFFVYLNLFFHHLFWTLNLKTYSCRPLFTWQKLSFLLNIKFTVNNYTILLAVNMCNDHFRNINSNIFRYSGPSCVFLQISLKVKIVNNFIISYCI